MSPDTIAHEEPESARNETACLKEHNEYLKDECERLKDDVASLQYDVGKAGKRYYDLLRQFSEDYRYHDTTVAALKEKNFALEQEIETLEKCSGDDKDKIAALEKENEALKKYGDDKNEELKKYGDDNKARAASIRILRAKIGSLEEEKKALKICSDDNQVRAAAVQELKDKIAALEEENETLKKCSGANKYNFVQKIVDIRTAAGETNDLIENLWDELKRGGADNHAELIEQELNKIDSAYASSQTSWSGSDGFDAPASAEKPCEEPERGRAGSQAGIFEQVAKMLLQRLHKSGPERVSNGTSRSGSDGADTPPTARSSAEKPFQEIRQDGAESQAGKLQQDAKMIQQERTSTERPCEELKRGGTEHQVEKPQKKSRKSKAERQLEKLDRLQVIAAKLQQDCIEGHPWKAEDRAEQLKCIKGTIQKLQQEFEGALSKVDISETLGQGLKQSNAENLTEKLWKACVFLGEMRKAVTGIPGEEVAHLNKQLIFAEETVRKLRQESEDALSKNVPSEKLGKELIRGKAEHFAEDLRRTYEFIEVVEQDAIQNPAEGDEQLFEELKCAKEPIEILQKELIQAKAEKFAEKSMSAGEAADKMERELKKGDPVSKPRKGETGRGSTEHPLVRVGSTLVKGEASTDIPGWVKLVREG